MKKYRGQRVPGSVKVTVDGRLLDPRYDLVPEITAEFEWGYDGAGPCRLALAILAHFYDDDEKSVALHRQFVRAFLAQLQTDRWELAGDAITSALESTVDVPLTLAELMQKARDLR